MTIKVFLKISYTIEILTGFKLKEDAAKWVAFLTFPIRNRRNIKYSHSHCKTRWQVVPTWTSAYKWKNKLTCVVLASIVSPLQWIKEGSSRVLKPCKSENCGIAMFSSQRAVGNLKMKAETRQSCTESCQCGTVGGMLIIVDRTAWPDLYTIWS